MEYIKNGKYKRNTIKTEQDIEIYTNSFWYFVDEYISGLEDKEDIKNRICFSGCLRYIYNHLFKPGFNDYIISNRNSTIDYSDINELYFVYDLYLQLCSKYKIEYTLNGFLTLTGISKDIINNWQELKQIPKHDMKYSNDLWKTFVEKVKSNSEQALHESMLGGNLMAYATLKCWYGWKEEQTVNINQISNNNIQSIESIAQNHNIQIPEKPDFN